MGYPVYKLLRAVNRQYPNNGFINYVDVREDMYDTDDESTNKIIDEDLRDLINETLQEVYIHVARDEVYSFPTVPGQREYSLPEDCDLRDIQEVTRTFRKGWPGPMPHMDEHTAFIVLDNNGGTGYMETIRAEVGDTIEVPECTFTPPSGKTFDHWEDEEGNVYNEGDDFVVEGNNTLKAVWKNREPHYRWVHEITLRNSVNDENYITVGVTEDGETTTTDLYYNQTLKLYTGTTTGTLGDNYDAVNVTFYGSTLLNLDMTQEYTENTTIDITHPIVPPGGETPGDNGDGGDGDNPLDGDDNNSGSSSNPAVPVVTPTGGD